MTRYARTMRLLLACVLLGLTACSDPAEFRPAKGVKDLPSTKTAYRVQQSLCDAIGIIKSAESIEDIATTVANNGGTEFVVLHDQTSETVETDFRAAKTFGVTRGHASSRVDQHHLYTAQAFRCAL